MNCKGNFAHSYILTSRTPRRTTPYSNTVATNSGKVVRT
jgi:hypothetical protein